MESTRRLFVAIPVPGGMIKLIRSKEKQIEEMYPQLPVRWTPLDNLYVPVDVFGPVKDSALPEIVNYMEDVLGAMEVFDLVFDRIVLGPSSENAKMVWLTLSTPHPAFGILVSHVKRALAPMHPDMGVLSPHVTLGQILQKEWKGLEEKPEIVKEVSMIVPVDNIIIYEQIKERGAVVFVPMAVCELGTSCEEAL